MGYFLPDNCSIQILTVLYIEAKDDKTVDNIIKTTSFIEILSAQFINTKNIQLSHSFIVQVLSIHTYMHICMKCNYVYNKQTHKV